MKVRSVHFYVYLFFLGIASWMGAIADASVVVEVGSTMDDFRNATKDEHKIYVVKFYADWCGPCKMYKPAFASFAKEHTNPYVQYLQVNVDKSPFVTKAYGITSFPTTIIIRNDKVFARLSGGGGNVIKDLLENLNKCGIVF